MKKQADLHYIDIQFQEGDLVYFKLQPQSNHHLLNEASRDLEENSLSHFLSETKSAQSNTSYLFCTRLKSFCLSHFPFEALSP